MRIKADLCDILKTCICRVYLAQMCLNNPVKLPQKASAENNSNVKDNKDHKEPLYNTKDIKELELFCTFE